MKRNDLVTPSGIDHDYNYLTSIERQLDNAERDAIERGFLLENENSKIPAWRQRGLNGPKKGEMPMKAAIEKCGVIVEQAPEGMARRKQNATYWDRKCVNGSSVLGGTLMKYRRHRLLWTVEWIHHDGRKELGICPEFDHLQDAYAAHVRSTMPKEDPDQTLETPPRKRAKYGSKASRIIRDADIHTEQGCTQEGSATQSTAKDSGTAALPAIVNDTTADAHLRTSANGIKAQPREKPLDPKTSDVSGCVPPADDGLIGPQDSETPTASAKVDTVETLPSQIHKTNSEIVANPDNSPLHFYLHAPRLPSYQPVLIPLASDSTLSNCLRNNLVLEFPSIYVLKEDPMHLPNRYITEGDFDRKMQQEGFRDSILAKLSGNEEGEIEEGSMETDNLDTKKIEEVLIRDLRQFKGEA